MNEDEVVEYYRQQERNRQRAAKQAKDKARYDEIALHMPAVGEQCTQLFERINADPNSGGELIEGRVLWLVATEFKTSTRDPHDYQMGGYVESAGFGGSIVSQQIHRDHGWVRSEETRYYLTFDGSVVSQTASKTTSGVATLQSGLGPLSESSREAIGWSMTMAAKQPPLLSPKLSDEPHRIEFRLLFTAS